MDYSPFELHKLFSRMVLLYQHLVFVGFLIALFKWNKCCHCSQWRGEGLSASWWPLSHVCWYERWVDRRWLFGHFHLCHRLFFLLVVFFPPVSIQMKISQWLREIYASCKCYLCVKNSMWAVNYRPTAITPQVYKQCIGTAVYSNIERILQLGLYFPACIPCTFTFRQK